MIFITETDKTDKTRLIFRVEKKLWIEPKGEIFGWTTTPSSKGIGKIEKDSILIFNRLSPYEYKNLQPLEFLIIKPGPARIVPDNIFDFFESEIDDLTKEGAIRLLDSEEIDEMTITLTSLGEIFIKKPKQNSFDAPVLLPKDIFVVMSMREYNRSNGQLGIGEKIHFQKIIDAYSQYIGISNISPR